jgi:hypothetical protein
MDLEENDIEDLYDLDPSEDGYQEEEEEDYMMDGHMSPKHPPVEVLHHHQNINTITLTEYILGTLIVRVVCARDLKPMRRSFINALRHRNETQKRKGISTTTKSSSTNSAHNSTPATTNTSAYVNISFGTLVQRTSTEYDTCDPSWPRSQQYFFDVKLPIPELVLHEKKEEEFEDIHNNDNEEEHDDDVDDEMFHSQKPILSLSVFHTDTQTKSSIEKTKGSTQKTTDEFLGFASLDVTEVINGKERCLDRWLSLECGSEGTSQGSIRVIVEYEAADTPPRPGDIVRFTGFVNKRDIFPVQGKGILFRVIDAVGDEVVVSYKTKDEHWTCIFNVHRNMLISVERYVSALEMYQEEILDLSNKLANSPAVDVLAKSVKSIPEEGLLLVGLQAALGGMSLAGRWMNGGMSVAVDDIVSTLNLDGQHNPRCETNEDSSYATKGEDSCFEDDADDDVSSTSIASGMPVCPISGQKMRDPVVAADGHTYDRSSISRWLKTSDISPLTGTVMAHKTLVPNYLLISSLQRGEMQSEDGSQVTQC